MIPLEIRLTNFLSYRESAVVDLRTVHLACISGPNGAGKSTLLDAMTWALFGQSRARSDDDLVHTAAAADGEGAEVELIFDMEGVAYRVLRRKRVRKGTELEFQYGAEGDDGFKWHSLSEARTRETQAAIERVLRMNFEVFVNASFFLQGKADEFTSRTPGKRKEILAEVLGVTQWDAYSKRANAERRTAESDSEVLRRQMDEVAAELAEAEERQRQLEAALTQQSAVQVRLDDKEQVLQQARQVQSLIDEQQKRVDELAGNLAGTAHEVARLQRRMAELTQQLAQHETIVAEAARIEADFAAWTAADTAFQQWQALSEQAHRLEQEQNPLKVRLAAARSALEQQQQSLEAQRVRVEGAAVEQAERSAELAASQERLAALGDQLRLVTEAEAELRRLELEEERLLGERKQRQQEFERLTQEQQRVTTALQKRAVTEAERLEAQAQLGELQTSLAELTRQGDELAGWSAEQKQLAAQREQLKEEADHEKERIDQLSTETGGDCPLCGQVLTVAHRKSVIAQLNGELDQKRQAYRTALEREKELIDQIAQIGDLSAKRDRQQRELEVQQKRIADLGARLQTIEQTTGAWSEGGFEKQLAELKAWLDAQPALDAQQATIAELRAAVGRKSELTQAQSALQQAITRSESRLEQIERESAEWAAEGSEMLARVAAQLQSETFAPDERQALAESMQRLEALGYDAAQHEATRQQRKALAAASERQQALIKAQAALTPIKESLDETTRQHTKQVARQTEQEQRVQADAAALQALRAGAVDLVFIEGDVIRLREELSIASQTVGATRQKVAVLDDRRRQSQSLKEERERLELRIQRLKLLEEACGRNGVQALLIENALPEIEERANELLDRLSGGAMRVTFETQRELKSRDAVAETLDIHISDAAGERPYENYSGGEQFRVNFAVRLALSQVLAHRAGARLRTLVIDEGFGSQDPEGRQRLIESINAVQSDFECVLVITHIDELRDAFPARIEVTKGVRGSQVAVIAGL